MRYDAISFSVSWSVLCAGELVLTQGDSVIGHDRGHVEERVGAPGAHAEAGPDRQSAKGKRF